MHPMRKHEQGQAMQRKDGDFGEAEETGKVPTLNVGVALKMLDRIIDLLR